MSPRAPKCIARIAKIANTAKSPRTPYGGLSPANPGMLAVLAIRQYRVSGRRRRGGRGAGRDQQVLLVPDEVLVAVDRELVVLAHEDRRHRAGLFAVTAEDAARFVDL